MTLGHAETPIFVLTKYSNCFNYRKTSKEAHWSYFFSEAQNAGLTRNYAGLIKIRVLLEGEPY